MSRRNRRLDRFNAEEDGEINLTPMLDVVFILLIFFIVTAQFIKVPGVDPFLESVENKERIFPLGILLAIDENSDVYMDKEIVPIEEVEFRVRQARQSNPKGEIVVQADSSADAEALVKVVTAIENVEQNQARVNISVLRD